MVMEDLNYKIARIKTLTFVCDRQRHLVCRPYSIENLHLMALALRIHRCWFHKDHYDIPKRRIAEITGKCEVVSTRQIWEIINGKPLEGLFRCTSHRRS